MRYEFSLNDFVKITVIGMVAAAAWFCLAVLGDLGYRSYVNQTLRSMAYELAPPLYPDSVLIDAQVWGGPTSQRDTRTYETQDDMHRVIDYFASYGFRFFPTTPVEFDGPAYASFACNTTKQAGEMAKFIVMNYDDYALSPCAFVTVYESGGQSRMRIAVSWPSD